jgi:hypothetical protein
MTSTEHPKTPTDATAFFARLCGLLRVVGSGMSKITRGGGMLEIGRRGGVVSELRSEQAFHPLSRLERCVPVLLCAVVGLLAFTATPALAAAPTIVSEFTSPTAKPTEEVRLEAAINPESEATKCDFQYGETVVSEDEAACTEPTGGIAEGGEQRAAVTVTGLKPGTTYHWRVVLENASGKAEGPDAEVTTAPETPETGKANPASIAATTATLEDGVLNPHKALGEVAEYEYRFRVSASECEGESATAGMALGDLKEVVAPVELIHLQPNVEYTFCLFERSLATGETSAASPPAHFTTKPAPPTVLAEGAGANSSEATLYATINPNNEETKYTFEYSTQGKTGTGEKLEGTIVKVPSTPGTIPSAYEEHGVEAPTGAILEAGKTYYYRVVAENAQSEKEPHPAEGKVEQFTTPPTPSTDRVTAIEATTATFNGHLTPLNANTATQYHFDYKLSGSECTGESSTPSGEAGKGLGGGASEATPVTELAPDRLYTVCFVTSNQFGSQVGPPVSFRTLPETYVTDVGSSSATLHAVLDPEGGSTSYQFEYGTSTEYGSQTPGESVEASGAGGSISVEAHIQELSPGSVYHFRVIATDATPETIASADQTFTTLPPGTGPGTASALIDNRQYELVSPPDKHGALVEPIDQVGLIESSPEGDAFTYITSAPTESQPQGNANATQNLSTRSSDGWTSQDIATPSDESSPGVTLGKGDEYQFFSPDLSRSVIDTRFAVDTGGFNTYPGEETSPHATEETPYLREDFTCPSATCYTPLLTTSDVTSGAKFGQEANLEGNLGKPADYEALEGATPNLSHVVLRGEQTPLTKATPTTPEAPEGGLYEWAAGQLQLVSVLPEAEGGRPAPAGNVRFGTGEGNGAETRNAISTDGSRIIWTASYSGAGPLYMRDTALGETVRLDAVQGGSGVVGSGGGPGPRPQFDMASSDGSTVFFTDTQQLTADSRAGNNRENGNREPDLYACNMVEVQEGGHTKLKCDLTDLTPDINPGEERADVQGAVLSASEDGSYVYFVANGVLGDGAEHGASAGDCEVRTPHGFKERDEEREKESCNLYVEHYNNGEWERPRFITALSSADSDDWYFGNLGQHTSGSSPDGRYLAFMSQRSLTGYDTSDVHEEAEYVNEWGEQVKRIGRFPEDQEVYLYHAEASPSGQLEPGKLVCASCNPTGARPEGERYFGAIQPGEDTGTENMRFVGGYLVWPEEQWLAANIPGWVLHKNRNGAHQPRYISNSGRLFFNSHSALVPQDVNGTWDVYEYEPPGKGSEGEGDCTTSTQGASDVYDPKAEGCVGLISSGESSEESAFLDASESGGDVFFMTLSQLVSQDIDHSVDVYDAHECTSSAPCFPPAAETPPPCTTEASCKPSPEPLPSIYGPPPSATFSGPGNLAPPPPPVVKKATTKRTVKCKKGDVKNKKGKCLKKKKSKKRSGKSSKSNRGGKS